MIDHRIRDVIILSRISKCFLFHTSEWDENPNIFVFAVKLEITTAASIRVAFLNISSISANGAIFGQH